MPTRFETVDQYIDSFPLEVREILVHVRRSVRTALPGAEESIRYQIPAIELDGRGHLYFAGWKRHVGLYPISPLDAALEREIAPFRSGKATVRFPLSKPVPYDLIERIAAAHATAAVTRT